MSTDSSTIITLDLKQQVTLLVQMVDTIRQDVYSGGMDANRVVFSLNQLSANLNRLTRQVAQLEDDHNNLVGMTEIGKVVNSSLEINDVLRMVMDTIIRLTGAERGFLMMRDSAEHDAVLTIRIARNWEKESINSSEFAISQTIINRVVQEGQPVLTTNAQEDPRFGGQESIIAYNLRSILCVPLKVKDEVTGVIYTDNRFKTGIFTDAKRNLLLSFANQAAVALENARLFESVNRTLAEVSELKNLMDNVFASIASGVITSDVTDKIVLCNRATEQILGRSQDTLIGRDLSEILPPLSGDLPDKVHAVRDTDHQMVGLEVNSILPERGPVFLSLNVSPLKDASHITQGVAIVLDDLTEKRRLEGQTRLFGRMVSPAVIRQLDPDKISLGGTRAQLTTLFADVRGFTNFSERYDPVELVRVLNRYLAAAADAVLAEEGTIDKFLGDAVMAWFNAPIPQPDHALRAVRAALNISRSVYALHRELDREFHLLFGVGVHYGDAVLGMVGTEKRLDYTAIGDSVNTAKRIQENSAGGQILISDVVYEQVKDHVEVRLVEPVQAKGKALPITVYEVLRLKQ
jgi:PAS domain S-box-containing protein